MSISNSDKEDTRTILNLVSIKEIIGNEMYSSLPNITPNEEKEFLKNMMKK